MSYILLSEATPFAKKVHKCIWCGENIEIGENYTRIECVYEGDFSSQKWHPECLKASQDNSEGYEWEFSPYENDRPETK